MTALPERLSNALAGRYRIERELGAGGMATVYLAEDLKHDRKVAIKVLKPELAAVLGADRFVVEIKTTASLQHPHILPLFDSGTADGFLFYVMPYIQGETIREKLNRETQFGVDEAVRIAREVADALDYAHRHGVIHRDIKPENLLLHDGRAMVMDFGIALAVSAAAGGRMTETGLSLGTPHYMSPEQATAEKEITGRSDVYSLASVLYEMLAGQPPHLGGSAQQIIMKIIAEPAQPVTHHRRSVPPQLADTLARALEKLPADRFSTAREFAQALAGEIPALRPGFAGTSSHAPASRRAALARVASVGVGVLGLVVGAWGWLRSPSASPPLRARFIIELPDSVRVSSTLAQQSIVIAADGSEFVYPTAWGGGRIMRRRLDDLTVTPVQESRGAWNPRYSPDGQSMLLQRGVALTRVPLAGGPGIQVTDTASRPNWGDDGSIVFTRRGALWRIGSGERTASQLTFPDSGDSHLWPHVLPGGEAVLFEIEVSGTPADADELAVVRVGDGSVTRLGYQGSNPRYVRTGHVLVARQDGTVSAVAFDLRRLQATGEAVAVLSGVFVKDGGAAMYDVSDNGTLVYVAGAAGVNIVGVDREGRQRRITSQAGSYYHPRISPSGDRIAFTRVENGRTDVWILVLNTGQEIRLTRDGVSLDAEWSADGQRLAVVKARDAVARLAARVATDSFPSRLAWHSADGIGSASPFGHQGIGLALSPAGEWAAVIRPMPSATSGEYAGREISLLRLGGDSVGRPLEGPARKSAPQFSPDGRWIAYTSGDFGTEDVYVASVGDPATRVQISTNGGTEPGWAPDGRALYYRSAGRMMMASLSVTPRLEIADRAVLFDSPHLPDLLKRAYDVHPRTGELLMLLRGDSERERVVVVFGWLEEFAQKVTPAVRR